MSETGLEQLWAGWRDDYVVSTTDAERRGADAACVFCRIAASGPPSVDNLVVWRSELSFAVLNAYPYASGHLLVMPVRHVGELDELTTEESDDLWVGHHAGGRRPSAPPMTPTASTWAPTWGGPPGRASRRICTCTCCRGGRGTPTS